MNQITKITKDMRQVPHYHQWFWEERRPGLAHFKIKYEPHHSGFCHESGTGVKPGRPADDGDGFDDEPRVASDIIIMMNGDL